MAHDRQAADMAAIKAREAAVRQAIRRGDAAVECGPFNMQQLGLSLVVGDEDGRLWRYDGAMLVRVTEGNGT